MLRTTQRVTDGHDIAIVPGDELDARLPALITAPTDPVRLGAANRALERAGVPWRFGTRRAAKPARDSAPRRAERRACSTA